MDLLTQRRSMMAMTGPSIKPIQLVRNGNFTEGADGLDYWDTVYPATPSVTDGELRLEKSTSGTRGAMVASTSAAGAVSKTHVYYLKAELKAGTINANAGFFTSSYSIGGNTYLATSETVWVKKDVILSPVNNTDLVCCRAGVQSSGAHTYAFMRNICLIDLTATFGAGNEPDIDTCRRLFPKDYYEYYTGE